MHTATKCLVCACGPVCTTVQAVQVSFGVWHIPDHVRKLHARFGDSLRSRAFSPDPHRLAWSTRGPDEWAVITLHDEYPAAHLRLYTPAGRLAAKSTVDLTGTDEGDWDNLILPFDQIFDLPLEE